MNKLRMNTVTTFSKKTFAVAGLAAAVAMAGCSSDNPDAGGSLSTTAVSGIAVDGYIAGATVYVDYNNNGRKNAGEPSAMTDKDGYFSTSKDGDTDYCADDASALEKIHCLKVNELTSSFVIRTFGGFDLYTGEPFTGSLARRVTAEGGVVGNQMISPLTSILVDVEDEDDRTDLLLSLGLDADHLDADFLGTDFDPLIVNRAIKLHKIITLFSEVFTEQYDEFGQERSFPETPNAIIYKALAESLADSNLLDEAQLTTVFTNAQTAIRDLYEADEDLTAPIIVDGGTAVQNALSIINVIDGALDANGNNLPDVDTAKTRVIGVETVVKKMIDGDGDGVDDNFDAAIAEAANPNSGLYAAIQDAFDVSKPGDDIDFFALTQVDYAAPDYNGIAVDSGDSFADLANKRLSVSFSDSGASGSGYFFFNSDPGASGGELKVCLRYDDGDAQTTEFEETAGVLLSGSWLALNDSKLILNLAGSLTLSLADKGLTTDLSQHRYSLSYGGETRSWLSDDGLLDELESQNVAEQPSDDASCATLLTPPQA